MSPILNKILSMEATLELLLSQCRDAKKELGPVAPAKKKGIPLELKAKVIARKRKNILKKVG